MHQFLFKKLYAIHFYQTISIFFNMWYYNHIPCLYFLHFTFFLHWTPFLLYLARSKTYYMLQTCYFQISHFHPLFRYFFKNLKRKMGFKYLLNKFPVFHIYRTNWSSNYLKYYILWFFENSTFQLLHSNRQNLKKLGEWYHYSS